MVLRWKRNTLRAEDVVGLQLNHCLLHWAMLSIMLAQEIWSNDASNSRLLGIERLGAAITFFHHLDIQCKLYAHLCVGHKAFEIVQW